MNEDSLRHASEHEVGLYRMSRSLYRKRQQWACGTAPNEPWMNPYARRTQRMYDIRDERGYGLSQAMWQIEERADRWEHRPILPAWFWDRGIYAEID